MECALNKRILKIMSTTWRFQSAAFVGAVMNDIKKLMIGIHIFFSESH